MLFAFICFFIIFYLWHSVGTSIGYHRLLAHRSFKCNKLVEYFWVAGGYLGFMSSPIWWATMHRAHHRWTDTEKDPHSPRAGFWASHSGWFFKKTYPDYLDPKKFCKDLVDDPVYKFLERGGDWHKAHLTNSAIGFGFRFLLLFLFGWPLALASLLAGITAQQAPLFLNVFCHKPKLGYQTYATGDDSVNVPWLTFLTVGENWHKQPSCLPGLCSFRYH